MHRSSPILRSLPQCLCIPDEHAGLFEEATGELTLGVVGVFVAGLVGAEGDASYGEGLFGERTWGRGGWSGSVWLRGRGKRKEGGD
jgi:hypothetical protein